jgi:hypothetical protein
MSAEGGISRKTVRTKGVHFKPCPSKKYSPQSALTWTTGMTLGIAPKFRKDFLQWVASS